MLEANDSRLVIVGRDTADGPDHPRYDSRCKKNFDEAIVTGMIEHGVKDVVKVAKANVPVTLRDGTVVQDALLVVDGRQRIINAREADRRMKESGLPGMMVPVGAPEKGTDAKLNELTVMLNEHRQEDSPLGRAHKAQWFIDKGYEMAQIANLFRVTQTSIANYLSLLNLRPEIQAMIEAGELPISKGYKLARMGTKAQAAFVEASKGGGEGGDAEVETKAKAPSKADLRKLLDKDLPADFLTGIRFALGLVDAAAVPGLNEALTAKTKAA
jgi:ParB family chromosome partitioning protein